MTDHNSDFVMSTSLPRSFLTALFSRCPETAFLTLSLIHPSGVQPVPSRHLALSQLDQDLEQTLTKVAVANRQGWGAYFGVAPRLTALGRWQRGGKRDLACLPALFVDIDSPDRSMLDRLKAFSLPATFIVVSGRGLHAYWLLRQPTTEFAAAETLMRRLTVYFAADTQSSSAHCLRLPGTWNTKYQPPRPCHLIGIDQTAIYDLADFQAVLPMDMEPWRKKAQIATDPLASGQYQYQFQFQARQPGRNAAPTTFPSAEAVRLRLRLDRGQFAKLLIRDYRGYLKSNGFIASLCPFPHVRDRPGAHFNYDPRSGQGYCFGKHGRIEAHLLSLALSS